MASPGLDNGWRNKIQGKRYKCSKCGAIWTAATNHWGTIYRGCGAHYYNAISECVEAEEFLKQLARNKT